MSLCSAAERCSDQCNPRFNNCPHCHCSPLITAHAWLTPAPLKISLKLQIESNLITLLSPELSQLLNFPSDKCKGYID